jgi:hypothetical protein
LGCEKASSLIKPTSVNEFVGGNVDGPSFVSEDFGLSREQPGTPQPDWINKKR